jgi:hypothetical protein
MAEDATLTQPNHRQDKKYKTIDASAYIGY